MVFAVFVLWATKEDSALVRIYQFMTLQGFQNKPAAAGAPAGDTRFTAGYFV